MYIFTFNDLTEESCVAMEAVRLSRLFLVNQAGEMFLASFTAKVLRVISLFSHTDTFTLKDRHLASVTKEAHAFVVVLLAVGLPILPREEPKHTERLWALGTLEAALMPGLVHSVDTCFTTFDRLATAGASGVEHVCVVFFAIGIVIITFADLGTITKVLEAHFAAKMSWMPCHTEGTKNVTIYDGFVTRCTDFHDFVLCMYEW